MKTHELPNGTMVLTNIQDIVPVIRQNGLPLHFANYYATVFVTPENEAYAHEKIAVPLRAKLESLQELYNDVYNLDFTEREDLDIVAPINQDNDDVVCVCEICISLGVFE